MAFGDILRVSFAGFVPTGTIVNTWHYIDRSGGATLFDATGVASDFWAAMQGFYVAIMNEAYTMTEVRAAFIAGPSLGRVGIFVPTTCVGLKTGPTVPPELCISVKRYTGYASRHNRGRLFIGPVSTSLLADVEMGKVDTTNDELLTFCNQQLVAFTSEGVGMVPVLVSKTFVPTIPSLNYCVPAAGLVHRKKRRTKGLGV